MDFGLVKSLSIAGKAVKALLLDGRLVWKKAEPGPAAIPYIETDGVASYIDLGNQTSLDTEIEITFMSLLEEGHDQTGERFHNVLNCGASTNTRRRLSISPNLGNLCFRNPTYDTGIPMFGRKFCIRISSSGVVLDGSAVPATPVTDEGYFYTPLIGTTVESGLSGGFARARYYSVKVWEKGVLVRDCIPYSGPRGVGLLDKVNDVLYTNAGRGTLTYGEEGGAWTNPYITDGLIGMWDAEWNEAGGVHNPDLMQLNDICGNIGPLPVVELGDFWMKRNVAVVFYNTDYPAISRLVNSEGHREFTYEGYSSFDTSVSQVTGNRYAFSSNITYVSESGGTSTWQAGYGLQATSGMCMNMRGFVVSIVSTVNGEDGVWRTYSCSTINKAGSTSVAYLDGVEYGRYEWSSGNVFTGVRSITIGGVGTAYWDKVKSSCLRIYDRVLSADEVAHNARVDRERFGGRL